MFIGDSFSGIVSLENILKSIIGPVEDEFDDEQPEIISEGPKAYIISGNTSIDAINQHFELKYEAHDVDTIAGKIRQERKIVWPRRLKKWLSFPSTAPKMYLKR